MATQSIKRSRVYKDIDLAFGVNAFSKDLNAKLDVNAVKQSIKNLILTQSQKVSEFEQKCVSRYRTIFKSKDIRCSQYL